MGDVRLSRGAVALRWKLRKRGANAELTRALGCSTGMVSRWLDGTRMPSVAQAAYIERRYKVRCAWWSEPPQDAQKRDAA